MPLPPVVIELSAADAQSEHAPTLVAACSSAVTEGKCQLGPESGATRAVVIVSWDSEHRRAHLQIGAVRGGRDEWTNRDLHFRESDPMPERWKSVGLIIGTLVGAAEREQEEARKAEQSAAPPPPAAPAARQPKPTTAPPPPAAEPPRPGRVGPDRIWLGIELVAGPALDDGSWRFGPGLMGMYEAPELNLVALGGARYLQRPKDSQEVSMRWLELSLGPGVAYEPSPGLRLEGTTEALAQRIDASAESDSGGNWALGMRVGLSGGVEVGDWGLLTLGGHASGLSRGTIVSARGETVGRAPPLTFGASAGFRFRLR